MLCVFEFSSLLTFMELSIFLLRYAVNINTETPKVRVKISQIFSSNIFSLWLLVNGSRSEWTLTSLRMLISRNVISVPVSQVQSLTAVHLPSTTYGVFHWS